MEYILILALCIFGSVVMDTYGALRNRRFHLCSIILFCLWFVSAFRYQMGSDGLAYEYDFYNNAVDFRIFPSIFGRPQTSATMADLSFNSEEFNSWLLMQFFVASFVLPTITVFAYRSSPFPLTVLLFFFISFYHYFSFEILRGQLR